jgi:ABC-type Fe3+/spermidine/putrescine transport system ATPase subunit
MVFQHYALFPHMTVEENVAFGLEARGVSRRERLDRARAALDAVGLEGAGRRPVQALSGGEQQRVALARATVIEPRVLLLDEPLSNLDPTLRESTREELRAMLHRLQLTALFVTHDQEDAFAIADRVALLERGVLLQVGAPEELYDRPASRAVARFIGRSTLVPAVLSGAEACVTLGGVQQRAPARAARGGELAALRDAGYTLAVLRPEMLSLVAADAAGAWPGRVVARRFVGALTVCRVAVDERTTLEVATPTRDVAEGDAVGVRLAGETVPMVPA